MQNLSSPCDFPLSDTELPLPYATLPVLRVQGEEGRWEVDSVIAEVPVALVYNGISYVVMLASPYELDDFALGFSLSEGIIGSAAELYSVEIIPDGNGQMAGVRVEMEIASACFLALKARRRQLAGRTGCGLCGVDSLQHFRERALARHKQNQCADTAFEHTQNHALAPASTSTFHLTQTAIYMAVAELGRWQHLHQHCGAAHAAAWVDDQGKIHLVREDVGRHNALDKLLGALAKSNPSRDQSKSVDRGFGFILMSSRASYELVQKTVQAGQRALVVLSAPTALAVHLAQEAGLFLAGFTHQDGMVVYAGSELLAPNKTERGISPTLR